MGRERRAPVLEVVADVDLEVDLGLWRAQRVAVVHRPVRVPVGAAEPGGPGGLEHPAHRVAVHGRLEHPRGELGQLRAPVHEVVDLDVVRVAVAAVPVIADDDIGALLVEQLGQTGGGLVEVGLVERPGVLVLLPAGHARVGVAEPDHPVHAEDLGRDLRLPPAPVHDGLARGEVVGGLAVVAVGGEDDHHPVALRGRPGHRPGGLGCLVVGVGMDEDDGRHTAIMHRPRPARRRSARSARSGHLSRSQMINS